MNNSNGWRATTVSRKFGPYVEVEVSDVEGTRIFFERNNPAGFNDTLHFPSMTQTKRAEEIGCQLQLLLEKIGQWVVCSEAKTVYDIDDYAPKTEVKYNTENLTF